MRVQLSLISLFMIFFIVFIGSFFSPLQIRCAQSASLLGASQKHKRYQVQWFENKGDFPFILAPLTDLSGSPSHLCQPSSDALRH